MKKILVTGSSGFIGKELIKKTSDLKIITDSTNGEKIDLLNKNDVMKIESADIVIHLASKTPLKELDDLEYFRNNLIITTNVLEYCIKKKIKKLIYISSYVYGNPEYFPIDENHPINPHNAYTESKYIGERLCKFFSENSKLNVIILRPFNIFGESMKDGYFLSNIINSSKTNEKIKILNKNSKRDFLHVNDFVNAILRAIDYECKFEIFNVGSGESFSFEEIISKIENFLNIKLNIDYNDDKKQSIQEIEADITKIKNSLNWKPKRKFEEELLKMLKK